MSASRKFLIWSTKNDKSEMIDGKFFSKLIDPTVKMIKEKNIACTEIVGGLEGSEKDSYLCENFICFLDYYQKPKKISLGKIIQGIKKKCGFLEKSFDLGMERAFAKILENEKITDVIGIEIPIELIFECKKRKIPIFEIAHGYGYSKQKPPSCMRNRRKELFPDHLIVLDGIAYKNLVGVSENQTVHFCEHPFLNDYDHWANQVGEKAKAFLDELEKKRKVIVLCSLNWGYDKDHPEMRHLDGILKNGLMHESLIDTINKTKSDIHWLIRPHPVHVKNKIKYRKHFEFLENLKNKLGNVDWELCSQIPLMILMRNVDRHVTMRSETAYDAALLGVKTVFLCPLIKIEEYFKDIIEAEFASTCELKSEAILSKLKDEPISIEPMFFSNKKIISVVE